MGPFVGSDDHIVRVVNRNGNACRQARVHWLLASLVNFKTQEHLKNLGTAVEIISVHTDLHRHIVPIKG